MTLPDEARVLLPPPWACRLIRCYHPDPVGLRVVVEDDYDEPAIGNETQCEIAFALRGVPDDDQIIAREEPFDRFRIQVVFLGLATVGFIPVETADPHGLL